MCPLPVVSSASTTLPGVAVKSGLPHPFVVLETARKNSNGHSGFSKAGTISELTFSS